MADDFEFKKNTVGIQNRGRSGLRTRGVVRTRGFAPTAERDDQASPVRTRGAVRARSADIKKRIGSWREFDLGDLTDLMNTVRNDHMDGFPLNIVVENPESKPARSFIDKVRELQHPRDNIWLLGHRSIRGSSENYLDLSIEDDANFAGTLVADILFVHGGKGQRLQNRLNLWKHRARAIIASIAHRSQIPENEIGVTGLRFLWLT